MDITQRFSLGISILALGISGVAALFQYQSRQDTIEERLTVELKMVYRKSPLNPLDLRMLSGVEERKDLKAAILITNMGNTTTRILEAGYHDRDQPKFAFYGGVNDPKVLLPGEQALFIVPEVVKIDRQLTANLLLGEEKNARIFATSTKGKRFDALALIEVAK